MRVVFYHANPASMASVTMTTDSGTDESIAQIREVLAKAIELSGREHWLWSPGALVSMHNQDGTLVAAWRDNRAMTKYSRHLDSAWDVYFGERSDVEHCVDGSGHCVSVDYTPRDRRDRN